MSTVFYFFLQRFFAPVEGGVRQCGWLCAKTADIRLFCCKNICRISGRSGGSGLHSAQFYVIISDELNRKQQVPSAALRGGKGKREAGTDPARSRHCDKGVRVRVLCAPATGALLREGDAGRRSFSQETCLLLVPGLCRPRSRGIGCTKKPVRYGVFLLCHFASGRPRFFTGSLSCTLLFGAVFHPHQERKTR